MGETLCFGSTVRFLKAIFPGCHSINHVIIDTFQNLLIYPSLGKFAFFFVVNQTAVFIAVYPEYTPNALLFLSNIYCVTVIFFQ